MLRLADASTVRGRGLAAIYLFAFLSALNQFPALLGEQGLLLHRPRYPFELVRFGRKAFRSAVGFARAHFREERAQALFVGCAAHSFLPLLKLFTAAMGLVMGLSGLSPGWPIAQGGAQRIADALGSYARSLGVTFFTQQRIDRIDQLPTARAYLLDVSPRQLAAIAGPRLPPSYCARLRRYRYGPAAYKVDWAPSEAIPWRAAACQKAAAPPHRHIGWAYAHVPPGWAQDVTELIEARIESFAPGFRDTILARSGLSPTALEKHNPNYVGGHILGSGADLGQLFTRLPYSTPDPALFICSASTRPGAGVHGMCGYHAAQAALKQRVARHR